MKQWLFGSCLFLFACASEDVVKTDPNILGQDPWQISFLPPEGYDTPRVHLEPLKPESAELDYQAFMSSVEHLQRTLHWGSWPSEDMTLEQNREDLKRHWLEFEAREAYAYTVLTPDRSRCVGCVYLNPIPGENGRPNVAMAYWTVAEGPQTDLDLHLARTSLRWIEREWPFERLLLMPHVESPRQIEIARELGLEELEPKGEQRVFVWRRAEG